MDVENGFTKGYSYCVMTVSALVAGGALLLAVALMAPAGPYDAAWWAMMSAGGALCAVFGFRLETFITYMGAPGHPVYLD